MRKNIFCLILISFITGCSFLKQEEKIVINDEIIPEVDHDYDEVKEYQLSWDSIFDVELDTYYVYFYSLTCSHCSMLKNEIIEEALERKDIYFVKGSNKDVLRTDINYTIGAEIVGDFAIVGYPSLVKIEHGKVVKNVAGNSQILILLS